MSLLAPARGMPTLWPRQEVCKRWPQRLYLACLPLKLDGFSRPSLKPVPASSSNASKHASSSQGSKAAYPSSTLSAGSHRGLFSRRSLLPALQAIDVTFLSGLPALNILLHVVHPTYH